MTAVNCIGQSGVVKQEIGTSGNPGKKPQAVLTLFPVVDEQRPFVKDELWNVMIDGNLIYGPASRSECEAYANQFNQEPLLPVAESVETSGRSSAEEATDSEQDSLRFSVLLVPMRHEFEWNPKGSKSPFPSEHANLPMSIAIEIAEYLNGIEHRIKKGKRAIVTRRVSDSKGRWSVLSVPGTIDPVTSEFRLSGVRMHGATLSEATKEVNRINSDIFTYSRVPKVWAVLCLEPVTEVESNA